jgi:hypothetical protein
LHSANGGIFLTLTFGFVSPS